MFLLLALLLEVLLVRLLLALLLEVLLVRLLLALLPVQLLLLPVHHLQSYSCQPGSQQAHPPWIPSTAHALDALFQQLQHAGLHNKGLTLRSGGFLLQLRGDAKFADVPRSFSMFAYPTKRIERGWGQSSPDARKCPGPRRPGEML